MSLTNIQYESIMRHYEEIQSRNRMILADRILEVHQSIPEYQILDENLATLRSKLRMEVLEGNADSLQSIREEIGAIRFKKSTLLTAHQYPVDYIDPIYTCSTCSDTGYVQDAVSQRQVKCSCFKQKEISLLYEQSNIVSLFETNNFSRIEESFYQGENLEHFRLATKDSKNFVKNFIKDYQNILFYGTVGTGKSFLSCCIAKELIEQQYSVLYFSAHTFFELSSSYSFNNSSAQEAKSFYDDIYSCDLLIIDDLGTELTNTFVTSQLFACINERYLRKKPMIISTNHSLKDIQIKYSDRIFSRIMDTFKIRKLAGDDIRILKKTVNNQKVRTPNGLS